MTLITTNLLQDLLIVLSVLSVSVVLYFKWAYGYWKRRNIPYLEPKIPFGNLENALRRKNGLGIQFKRMHEELKARGCKYGGTFSMATPVLAVIDPEIIKNILIKKFQHFTDRGLYSNEEIDPLSGHLFLLNGAKWKNMRNKLSPTFTSGKMKMMFSTMAECSNLLVESVDKFAENQEPLDIKEALACFTTDIIGSCAFGLECNSFKDSNSVFREYGKKLINPSLWRVAIFTFVVSFPKIASKLGCKMFEPDIEKFYIDLVKDTVGYREKTNFTRNDFIQILMELKKEFVNGDGLTLNEMAAQVFVFFVAGFETSSTAMTFCLFELSQHPEIQDKVREEVNTVLKRHQGVVSYEAIQEMKYLAQVLDETLRKYPPLPVLHRQCTSDCVIDEDGLVLEKGMRTMISTMALHYDPEYYPDPEKFDPERFSEENKKHIKPCTYLPFGDGPRNCIGLRFGLMQSKVGLAMLLKNFEFSLNSKTVMPLKFFSKLLILGTKDKIYLNSKRIE